MPLPRHRHSMDAAARDDLLHHAARSEGPLPGDLHSKMAAGGEKVRSAWARRSDQPPGLLVELLEREQSTRVLKHLLDPLSTTAEHVTEEHLAERTRARSPHLGAKILLHQRSSDAVREEVVNTHLQRGTVNELAGAALEQGCEVPQETLMLLASNVTCSETLASLAERCESAEAQRAVLARLPEHGDLRGYHVAEMLTANDPAPGVSGADVPVLPESPDVEEIVRDWVDPPTSGEDWRSRSAAVAARSKDAGRLTRLADAALEDRGLDVLALDLALLTNPHLPHPHWERLLASGGAYTVQWWTRSQKTIRVEDALHAAETLAAATAGNPRERARVWNTVWDLAEKLEECEETQAALLQIARTLPQAAAVVSTQERCTLETVLDLPGPAAAHLERYPRKGELLSHLYQDGEVGEIVLALAGESAESSLRELLEVARSCAQ